MNISSLINQEDVKKRVFKPKHTGNDGLLLQIHNTIERDRKPQRIRFIHACFDPKGCISAAADFSGNIFLVDLVNNKFWVLPSINSCTALKFSTYNELELIIGVNSGSVYIMNTDTAEITAEWKTHTQPVEEITFSHDNLCLTASRTEAVVWDLKSNSRVQILTLNSNYLLKLALFMPVTSNILACLDDDTILIWKHKTFEVYKYIEPNPGETQVLQSIAFTRNGRAMVVGGHLSVLTVFMLDTWTISKTITLPTDIQSIKKIDFIPQLFDGGANRILAILAKNGQIYFYDIDQEIVVNKIIAEGEIVRFVISNDGKYIACVLQSGEVNIYIGNHYILSHSTIATKPKIKSSSVINMMRVKRNSHILENVQRQMQELLNIDKLRRILNEFGQYPDTYRIKIWTHLLGLPNNKQQYSTFDNCLVQSSFENLTQEYPLENKIALKNLKKLLCNLVTWCPYFAHVTYLPVFVFPFIKVFQNEPVLGFEAVCTIILNWCQYWFEYFPLPPINVLAMIENVLLEQDQELLKYLANNGVTSKLYAWPLLETAFSEVLIITQWCRLWDHILTNEPAFLLMCVVAYNILNKQTLLSINTLDEFEFFYHNQNIIDMKRLISKSYSLLNNTSERNHPRVYLNAFKQLDVGSYPTFTGFPKIIVDFDAADLGKLQKEKEMIEKESNRLLKEHEKRQQEEKLMEREHIESERLKALEQECRNRILVESERVQEQRRRLIELRKQLQQEEMDVLNQSRAKIMERNTTQRKQALEKLLNNVEQSRKEEEIEVSKAEMELLNQYSNLLLHKAQLEDYFNAEEPQPGPSDEYKSLQRQQQKLADVVESIHKDSASIPRLRNLNITTGLAIMDDLIMRIEMEMARQTAQSYEDFNKTHSNLKVLKLEAETKQLETEVSKLLGLLADLKSQETKNKLWDFRDSISSGTKPILPQSSISSKQKSRVFKDNVISLHTFGKDLGKLNRLVKPTYDVYMPQVSSYSDKEESSPSEELASVSLSSP